MTKHFSEHFIASFECKTLKISFSQVFTHCLTFLNRWVHAKETKKNRTHYYWLNSLIDICSQRTWRFVKTYCCSWSHMESYQNAKVLSFPVWRILHSVAVSQILILKRNDCVVYKNLAGNVIFHLFHCTVINYKLPAWNSHLEQQLTIPLIIRPWNLQVHHVHQSSIHVSLVSI